MINTFVFLNHWPKYCWKIDRGLSHRAKQLHGGRQPQTKILCSQPCYNMNGWQIVFFFLFSSFLCFKKGWKMWLNDIIAYTNVFKELVRFIWVFALFKSYAKMKTFSNLPEAGYGKTLDIITFWSWSRSRSGIFSISLAVICSLRLLQFLTIKSSTVTVSYCCWVMIAHQEKYRQETKNQSFSLYVQCFLTVHDWLYRAGFTIQYENEKVHM